MARIKGRTARDPEIETVPVFTRVVPEAKAVITRGSKALGMSGGEFLDELLRRAGEETPEGLPRWALERFKAQQVDQLDMGMSA